MLSLELAGGKTVAFRFLDALELVLISNNLGDAKSLDHSSGHHHAPAAERRAAGFALQISDGLVRLSVGLEDPNDLFTDIFHAMVE